MALHDDLSRPPGIDLAHSLRQLLHRNQQGVLDSGGGVLLGRAAVEEEALAGMRLLENAAGLDGGDLE